MITGVGKPKIERSAMINRENYPWGKYLLPDDKVSPLPTYDTTPCLQLFEKKVFPAVDEKVGDLVYYFYDPIEHGFSKDGSYPLIFALHGAGAALHGIDAVAWSGAAMFASSEYQNRMGGAYILVPLANEKLADDGSLQMLWMTPSGASHPEMYEPEILKMIEPYLQSNHIADLLGTDTVYAGTLYSLLHSTMQKYPAISNTVLFGTSSGGYGGWRMLINHPEDFSFAVLMAGAYLPATCELQKIEESGCEVLICHSRNDEAVPFGLATEPNLPFFERSRHFRTWCPVLARRGDYGVASNAADGFEMGQHCINDIVQQDLRYDDGTPCDPGIPEGITGLIRKYTQKMTHAK